MNFEAGQTIRFTYNHPKEAMDEATGDRFKEVFILQPNWQGQLHAIDLKRLTEAERKVLYEIMDPKAKEKVHRIPLVTDILLRMNPVEDIKNPMSFYNKFVKQFLKNKDAYRIYEHARMLNATVVRQTEVIGKVQNPKPLFHKVESKSNEPTGTEKPKTTDDRLSNKAKADRLAIIKKAAAKYQK